MSYLVVSEQLIKKTESYYLGIHMVIILFPVLAGIKLMVCNQTSQTSEKYFIYFLIVYFQKQEYKKTVKKTSKFEVHFSPMQPVLITKMLWPTENVTDPSLIRVNLIK